MDIVIKQLDYKILQSNLQVFLKILRENPNEYWNEGHLLRDLPEKFELSLVAFNHLEIIGFIIASKKNDGAHIHKFMVAKRFQGKGIGSLMQQHFDEKIKKSCVTVSLTVVSTNLNAIRFYKGQGYALVDEREDSVNKDTLIILQKNI